MGFVTQSPQDQFVADTVLDEVAVSLRHSTGAGNPAAGAEEVLRRIQLWRFRRLSPYMLSQGQQRRLGVAALLAYDCRVLVLRRAHLCPGPRPHRRHHGRPPAREVVERGLTLILSTHDRALAQDYADILYELKEGSLYEVLNPACKLIGLVVPTLLLAGLHHPAVNLAVFAVCLAALLLSRANVKVLAGALLPVLLVAVGMFSTGYHFHAGAGMLHQRRRPGPHRGGGVNGLVLGSRVLAFAGLGLLFVLTTDRILLVRSLQQQLRLPPVFAYGLLAAWGILPNMMEEYKRTRAAFAARGIRVFPVSPALLKPPAGQVGALVRRSCPSPWSPGASTARVPRTCSQPLRLRPVDVLFPILSCALFLALFFLLGRSKTAAERGSAAVLLYGLHWPQGE